MSKLTAFLKGNPLAVVSGVMVIVFGVMVFLALGIAGEREALKKELDGSSRTVKGLSASVQMPPLVRGEDPEQRRVVVNAKLVEQADRWDKMRAEGTDAIADHVIAFNQGRHVPMLGNLFDKAKKGLSESARSKFDKRQQGLARNASVKYKSAMDAFLSIRLRSDLPPSETYIYEALAETRSDFKEELDLSEAELLSKAPLSKDDEAKCRTKQKQRWHTVLSDRASKILVYANPEMPELQSRQANVLGEVKKPKNRNYDNAFYPFQFDTSSQSGRKVEMDRIWEWQEQLWIIDDFVRAIELTNIGADGGAVESVREGAIKKLVRVHVGRGYVGVDNNNGLISEVGNSADAGRNVDPLPVADLWAAKNTAGTGFDGIQTPAGGGRGGAGIQPMMPGMGGGGYLGMPGFGPGGGFGGGAPRGGAVEVAEETSVGGVPIDFKISHTGRKSNSVYRVKHTVCTVVIEASKVPVFIDQLAKVNFNTVIGLHMSKVDLYDELLKGYVFEDKPVVELTLVIESLWLNEWVDKLMPEKVLKKYNEALSAGKEGAE